MKRVLILIAFQACFLLGQTRVELSKQVKGSLPADKGGTGVTSCGENEGLLWQSGTFLCSPLASVPHAASHQHGGTDEVATGTPGDNAIPKAGPTGTLADGWLPTVGPSKIDLTDTYPWTGTHTFTDFQDKGSQVFNVKAYGAVGNGATDDQAAIQTAIDAAKTAGGGKVFFPQGTYLLTATHVSVPETHLILSNADNVELSGVGTGSVLKANTADKDIIRLINGTNDNRILDLALRRVTCSLTNAITTGATSFDVTCPISEPATPFQARITDLSAASNIEFVSVTNVTGGTWTVMRVQNGPANRAFDAGDEVQIAVAGANGIHIVQPGGAVDHLWLENLDISHQWNGIYASNSRPKAIMSNIIVTVGANDGINLEMNNDEILDNLQLNRNARTGLRIGGNATVACEGGVYVT